MQRGRHSVEFLPDGKTVVLAHDVPDGNQKMLYWARIRAVAPAQPEPFVPPGQLKDLTPIDTTGATTLPLVIGHTLPDWNTGQTVFFIQAPMKPFQALTPDDVHSVLANGTYIWEVKNLTGSHHNFHTHGWSFQHIETEFVDLDDPSNDRIDPAPRLENKDTILLSRRPGSVAGRSWSITRLAVKFDDAGREAQVCAYGKQPSSVRSGGWLAHCHILEHAALGMMTFFQVNAPFFWDDFEIGDLLKWSVVFP